MFMYQHWMFRRQSFPTLEISDSTRNPSCSQYYDTLNSDEHFCHNYEILAVKQDEWISEMENTHLKHTRPVR